jgi:hypothetical protein
MNAIVIGAIVLACVFGGAVIGMALRSLLPSGHFEDSTKYTVS